MTQDTIKKIHRIYSWVLAATMIAVGIMVILSCIDLYGGVRGSYTPEAIEAHFNNVALPIYISIVGAVGGIILNLFLPLPRQRSKSVITPRETMLKMRQKVAVPPVQEEQLIRLVIVTVTAIVFISLMIYPIIYLITPGHFSADEPNPYIVRATIIAMIPTLIGLALCWVCQFMLNASYKRETAVYKQALIDGQRVEKIDGTNTNCSFNMWWVRIPLIIVAVFCIVIGFMNRGADDVLQKAIRICTECIGIG